MCVLLHLLICTALKAHIIVVEALYKINDYYYNKIDASWWRCDPVMWSNLVLMVVLIVWSNDELTFVFCFSVLMRVTGQVRCLIPRLVFPISAVFFATRICVPLPNTSVGHTLCGSVVCFTPVSLTVWNGGVGVGGGGGWGLLYQEGTFWDLSSLTVFVF